MFPQFDGVANRILTNLSFFFFFGQILMTLILFLCLLESSSTGSSFPADSAKPVPLAVVSLDSR